MTVAPGSGTVPLRWRPRGRPLTACGVVARGETAKLLAARLLALDDVSLARLAGVAGAGFLAVLGEAEHLPWVDGIVYVGKASEAPALLLPTALDPGVPAPLLERALSRRFPALSRPFVLVPPGEAASLVAARTVDRATLERWP